MRTVSVPWAIAATASLLLGCVRVIHPTMPGRPPLPAPSAPEAEPKQGAPASSPADHDRLEDDDADSDEMRYVLWPGAGALAEGRGGMV